MSEQVASIHMNCSSDNVFEAQVAAALLDCQAEFPGILHSQLARCCCPRYTQCIAQCRDACTSCEPSRKRKAIRTAFARSRISTTSLWA